MSLDYNLLKGEATRDGLVGEWLLNNGLAVDTSINSNNGTVSGAIATKDRFNFADSALSFNGVSDHVSIAHDNIFNLTEFSISLWVNPASTIGASKLFTKGVSSDPEVTNYVIFFDDGLIKGAYEYGAGLNVSLSSVEPININSWTHIALTRNNSGVVCLYVAGVLVDSLTSLNAPSFNNIDIRIGSSIGGEYFEGEIATVRLYNKGLTADEVDNLYHETKEAKELKQSNLILHYPFIDNSNDESGNFNNLTLFGSPLPIIGQNGRYGEDKGVEFGTGQYALADNAFVVSNVLTVRVRFKELFKSVSAIVGRNSTAKQDFRFSFGRSSSSKLAVWIGDGSTATVTEFDGNIIDIYNDYFFVVDYINKTGYVTKNSFWVCDINFPAIIVTESIGSQLTLSAYENGSGHHLGLVIDDFRAWNGLLTNSTRKAIYRELPYKATI